jgi:hypothetical protein
MGYVRCFTKSRATGQLWQPAIVESETIAICTPTGERHDGDPVIYRYVDGRAVYYSVPAIAPQFESL